jgi:hypothetical protein
MEPTRHPNQDMFRLKERKLSNFPQVSMNSCRNQSRQFSDLKDLHPFQQHQDINHTLRP